VTGPITGISWMDCEAVAPAQAGHGQILLQPSLHNCASAPESPWLTLAHLRLEPEADAA